MSVHYSDDRVTVHHGDCLDVLRGMSDGSVDAIVTDPPYGLEFMGKDWDRFATGGKQPRIGEPDGSPHRRNTGTPSWAGSGNPVCRNCGGTKYDRTRSNGCACDAPVFPVESAAPNRAFGLWCEQWATECLRVLKPGGHMLVFGGTRTWHRLACAVEDAGFEMRDSIAWLYGSGFPKSLDVSKAIDRRRDDSVDIHQVQRFLDGVRINRGLRVKDINSHFCFSQTGGGPASKWTTNKASPAVPTWEQWTNLKEWLAFDDSHDALVQELNARKGEGSEDWKARPAADYSGRPGMAESWREGKGWTGATAKGGDPVREAACTWEGWGTALKPAFEPIVVARKPLAGTIAVNVLAHGTGGVNVDGCRVGDGSGSQGARPAHEGTASARYADTGGTDFAVAPGPRGGSPGGRWPANVVLDESQADALDEQSGVLKSGVLSPTNNGASRFFPTFRYQAKAPASERPSYVKDDGTRVAHPTVKPLALMRWLVRLVTPPGGTVLDPFAGSGATLEAAALEEFRVIGIEREADYLPLIRARIDRLPSEQEEQTERPRWQRPKAEPAHLQGMPSLLDLIDPGEDVPA